MAARANARIAARRGALLAVALVMPVAGWASAFRNPWNTAVDARLAFEAVKADHTREQFKAVMDNFRAIYHADPRDTHAAAAVDQVAELLAEQARELHDSKSAHDAAAQYAFLIRQYPTSSYAVTARREHLTDERRFLAAAETPAETHPAISTDPDATPTTEQAAAAPLTSAHADEENSGSGPRALVSGVRHWSTPNYTRVAIDLGGDVKYQAARVEHPDRIFFDIHHAQLGPALVGKSFAVTDDGFLTRIRAAQYTPDVVRLVLDVREVADYSAFLLPNPTRLIIDIHGKAPVPQQQIAENAAPTGAAPVGSSPENAAAAGAALSHLPPTPVTDGTESFGLASRNAASPAGSSRAAAPRVVIPTRATAAKPVPNSTSQAAEDLPTQVAAVSRQSGKVEATSHPTSAPIAAHTSRSADRGRSSRLEESTTESASVTPSRQHVKGAPTLAASPTADGETSLLRALGLKVGRIVIDAGHGGHDSGTLGVGGIEEKDVVLDVALRLGALLHDRLGAEIVYTRADDTFIPLETRTAIANKAQADLFISIHANSSQDPSARGVEVYYLNFTSDPEAMQVASRENAVSTQSVHELSDLVKRIALKDKIDESRELANNIDDALYAGLQKGNTGLKNRGVKKAPFVVLIGANMPSILAEISFVTNPTDAAELNTGGYRERVAESLYRGIAHYLGGINSVHSARPVQRATR